MVVLLMLMLLVQLSLIVHVELSGILQSLTGTMIAAGVALPGTASTPLGAVVGIHVPSHWSRHRRRRPLSRGRWRWLRASGGLHWSLSLRLHPLSARLWLRLFCVSCLFSHLVERMVVRELPLPLIHDAVGL